MECTKFMRVHLQMKIYMCAVGQYYINAVILANTHTCLYGSQASLYFMNCKPPTLENYFV